MANIHDVARRADVSIGTVSRVLNNRPDVSKGTRQAVLAAVAELNYRPNALARNFRRSRTFAVAMLVPNLANQSFVQMVLGAESAAIDRGYTLILACSHDSPDLESQQLARLAGLQLDGLICLPVESEAEVGRKLSTTKLPVTFLAGPPIGISARPGPTSFEAAFAEAMYDLVGFGHLRIALVTTTQPFAAAPSRIRTLRGALEAAGLSYHEELVRVIRTEQAAGPVVRDLLAVPRPPTALICGTLGVTPQALKAIHDQGLRVPDDLSFVTLGDSEWAEACQPGLNAITVDAFARARNATNRLIDSIEGDSDVEEPVDPVWRYVRRGSCGPAKRP